MASQKPLTVSCTDVETSNLSQILDNTFSNIFYIQINQRENEYIKYPLLFLCPSSDMTLNTTLKKISIICTHSLPDWITA